MGRVIKATTASLLASEADAPETRTAVIELACAMAERIVQTVVRRDPLVLNKIFAAALTAARAFEEATVRVHPEDRNVSDIDTAAEALGFEIETDEQVGRGGCVIAGRLGVVDATVPTLLDALKSVLKGTP